MKEQAKKFEPETTDFDLELALKGGILNINRVFLIKNDKVEITQKDGEKSQKQLTPGELQNLRELTKILQETNPKTHYEPEVLPSDSLEYSLKAQGLFVKALAGSNAPGVFWEIVGKIQKII